MSVLRPGSAAVRWLVPAAAAVVVIGGGAAAGTIVANAGPTLPERTAAQLLVDIQHTKVDGLSGTFVATVDVGLPAVAGLAKGAGGAAALAGLLAGNNTARVWHSGAGKERLAVLSTLGETDIIRDGPDVWLWNSADEKASHLTLPGAAGPEPAGPPEVAAAALAAITPTTRVETAGAVRVAGRDAYELVLGPRDPATLIGQVRLAIDAGTHLPLSVDIYAANATRPGVRIAFQQISYAVPDDEQFVFNPPPGTTTTEGDVGGPAGQVHPSVVGAGWTAVVEARLPKGQLTTAGNALPRVSGAWGSGRLFTGPLLSVLVTDGGAVFAGPVTPARLYEVAGAARPAR